MHIEFYEAKGKAIHRNEVCKDKCVKRDTNRIISEENDGIDTEASRI